MTSMPVINNTDLSSIKAIANTLEGVTPPVLQGALAQIL